MQNRLEATTIYLQPEVRKQLQHLAIDRGCLVSHLVNLAAKKLLEAEDQNATNKAPVRPSKDPELVAFLQSQGLEVPEDLWIKA